MKKFFLLIFLIINFFNTFSKDRNLERIESIVNRSIGYVPNKLMIVDSVQYTYPNSYIGGGLDQAFYIQNLKANNFNSIIQYEDLGQLNFFPKIKSILIKDIINNKYIFRTEGLKGTPFNTFYTTSEKIYQFDMNGNIISFEDITYQNNGKKTANKRLSYYNQKNEKIVDSLFYQNLIQTDYIKYGYKIFEYDNHSNLVSDIQKNLLDTITSKFEYEYDFKNRQVRKNGYYFNQSDQKMYLNYYSMNIFDDIENSIIYYQINVGTGRIDTAIRSKKKTILLDEKITDIYEYSWIDSFWSDGQHTLYKYSNNNLVDRETFSFNIFKKNWKKYFKNTFMYDDQNNLIQETYYSKLNDSTLFPHSQIQNEYNNNNNLIIKSYSNYDTITKVFIENSNITYHWKKYFKNQEIINEDNFVTSIYPNPTLNNFSIQFETENSTKCTFALFNLKGEVLDTKYFKSNEGLNNYNYSLNDLPTGEYIGMLNLNGKQKTFKVVKQ